MLVKVTLGVHVPPGAVNCHCTPTIWPAGTVDQLLKLESVVDTVVGVAEFGGLMKFAFAGKL
jgi:hypothetical protein